MGKLINLSGKKFSRILVLSRAPNHPEYGQARWFCLCDCGKKFEQYGFLLNSGKIKSCGCYAKERLSGGTQWTHGMTYAPEYRTWAAMRRRCLNSEDAAYPLYGGRGIGICPQWSDFERFFKDMGKKPSPSHSLDRINNNGNYEPSNCKWSTKKEQVRNRRTTVYITRDSRTLSLQEWANELGFTYSAIWARYKTGKRGIDLLSPPRSDVRRKSIREVADE